MWTVPCQAAGRGEQSPFLRHMHKNKGNLSRLLSRPAGSVLAQLVPFHLPGWGVS